MLLHAILCVAFVRSINPAVVADAPPALSAMPRPNDVEPGGRPEDVAAALFTPDEYAWRLFLFVCRQGDFARRGAPDRTCATIRDYDDDAPVIWETWAVSSGTDVDTSDVFKGSSDVFKDPATMPPRWEKLPVLNADRERRLDAFSKSVVLEEQMSSKSVLAAPQRPGPDLSKLNPNLVVNESRMNRAMFDQIRFEHLYSVEGIEAAIVRARAERRKSIVDFVPASKEIKAAWKQITEDQKNRYHWRTIHGNTWGLVALHITTKDTPNWFWCDFSHVDEEKKAVGWPKCRDSTTTSTAGIRPETVGSKWSNYVLRGTQTEFITATGEQTVLSNPVLEAKFEKSSCIACHSRAVVALRSEGWASPAIPEVRNLRSNRTATMPFEPPAAGDLLPPRPEDFMSADCRRIYFQVDFSWSLVKRPFLENPNTDEVPFGKPAKCEVHCPQDR